MHESVEYREVIGFPGYRVGSDGSVWSCLLRGGRPGGRTGPWKEIKKHKHSRSSHLIVYLSGHKVRQVHRLVLEAFVGPCPKGQECRHLNGVASDNRLENLAWGTSSENKRDAIRHGTLYPIHLLDVSGDKNGFAKLSSRKVEEIRELLEGGMRQKDVAARFGVTSGCISHIATGRTWKPRP